MGDESLLIDLRSGVYYSFQKGYAGLLDALLEGWTEDELRERTVTEQVEVVEKSLKNLLDFLLGESLVVERQDPPTTESQPLELVSLEFPAIEKFEDLQEIFEMDPIHEGDLERGWPVAN